MTALEIHDGRVRRPLDPRKDLGHRVEELLDGDPESLLYAGERELLDRLATRLSMKPPRRAADDVVELGREDVAVVAHALESLGRLRGRRLERLGEESRVDEQLDGTRHGA